MMKHLSIILFWLLAFNATAQAQDAEVNAKNQLQRQWGETKYQTEGKQQSEAFKKLFITADQYVERYPNNAAIRTLRGIIYSTYASTKSGLSALKYAKQAKRDYEAALKMDRLALNGAAATYLGTLYFKVPESLFTFGDKGKARKFLKKGLKINPKGMNANYFYGLYFYEQESYQKAVPYFTTALQAVTRTQWQIADEGRRIEIERALAEAKAHLKRL